jgi:DNA polymerase-1
VARFAGVEADDIAAYIVSKRKKHNLEQIWLISSDRDWNLLVDEGVSQFSYVTRKEFTVDNWSDHYDFTRDEYISIKCLMGDSGDNIRGVPGIGPKRALQLVQEYGSTYDICANLPINSKYKYITALNDFGADNLMLNYALMDLVSYSEEAIGAENCKTLDSMMENYFK